MLLIRALIILGLLLTPTLSLGALDNDNNGAIDIVKGGTDATTAIGARTNLGLVIGTDVAPALGIDDNYVTDAEKIVIGNTSGTNTGDQTIPVSGVDFDPVGTDNSTNVTLSGTPNYLTLTGQDIVLGQIDLTTDVLGVLADAQVATTLARDTEVTTAISNHEAAVDPHPGYLLESAAGTAALLNTGTTIGDVVAVSDVGYCSDPLYTDQITCETNAGAWTPVAGLNLTAVNLPTAAGYQINGTAMTAVDLGGATAAQGTSADTAFGWGDHSVAGYLSVESDPVFSAWTKDYADLINTPAIPTLTSDLTNDSGFLTTETDATAMAHIQMTLTTTALNDFVAGSVGFISSTGTVTLADASAEATAKNMLVISTGTTAAGASGVFAMSGLVTVTAHGYALGSPLFLSETAGTLTTTAPITSLSIIRVVGYAVDANTIYLSDDSTWVEVQ